MLKINTHPKSAQVVASILNLIEKNHCEISIDDKISWELEKVYEKLINDYHEEKQLSLKIKMPESKTTM